MSARELYETAADVLLRESGCTVRRYRKSMTGRAFTRADDWGIEVPRPRGPQLRRLAEATGKSLSWFFEAGVAA